MSNAESKTDGSLIWFTSPYSNGAGASASSARLPATVPSYVIPRAPKALWSLSKVMSGRASYAI